MQFDMEQQLLQCWSITDDIRNLVKTEDDEMLKALMVVYDAKFELLWSTFEKYVKEYYDLKKTVEQQ